MRPIGCNGMSVTLPIVSYATKRYWTRSRFWFFQDEADRWIQPTFLNRLDGFSTMGPFLFYIDGLKESHEAGNTQLKGLNE